MYQLDGLWRRPAEFGSGVGKLDHRTIASTYARWAPVYDLVFDKVMSPGRRALARAANRPSGKVLIVGVGTGLELPYLAPTQRLVGVDISQAMLHLARNRVRNDHLGNVVGLLVMDAMWLGFPDNSFDVVAAPYVLTVVPDPSRTLDEMLRVTKPGGEIVLVNHFGGATPALARVERILARYSARLGWHPEFSWQILATWLATQSQAKLAERSLLPPLGLFTLTRIEKCA
jgi:phosphatidylethanolamine/phosphatidyl-N-methylethanolamine N-methyltransferase